MKGKTNIHFHIAQNISYKKYASIKLSCCNWILSYFLKQKLNLRTGQLSRWVISDCICIYWFVSKIVVFAKFLVNALNNVHIVLHRNNSKSCDFYTIFKICSMINVSIFLIIYYHKLVLT